MIDEQDLNTVAARFRRLYPSVSFDEFVAEFWILATETGLPPHVIARRGHDIAARCRGMVPFHIDYTRRQRGLENVVVTPIGATDHEEAFAPSTVDSRPGDEAEEVRVLLERLRLDAREWAAVRGAVAGLCGEHVAASLGICGSSANNDLRRVQRRGRAIAESGALA